MQPPSDSSDLLSSAVRSILTSTSAAEAVEGLAKLLQQRYDLTRVALVVFTPGSTVLLVAQWGAVPQALKVGDEIAFDLTPTSVEIAGRMVRGEPVVFDPRSTDLGLVSAMLRSEGERTIAMLPLSDHRGTTGFFTLNSGRESAFASDDIALLAGVARATELALLALAGA